LNFQPGRKEYAVKLNPYLLFDGQCENGIRVLRRNSGRKIEAMMTHEGTPAAEQVPAQWRKKILHARLIVGDQMPMGSDAPPETAHSIAWSSIWQAPDPERLR
jgi:PhnB protein